MKKNVLVKVTERKASKRLGNQVATLHFHGLLNHLVGIDCSLNEATNTFTTIPPCTTAALSLTVNLE